MLLVAFALQSERPLLFGRAYFHRDVHWLAFAVTAGLVLLGAPSLRAELLRGAAVAALGLGLELIQHRLYGTPFDWADVRDDAAAVLTVFLLRRLTGYAAFRLAKSRRES